jgi:hypothetical protein
MSATIKKGSTSTALTRRKKRPTKKQKEVVRNAAKQQKKMLSDSANAALKGFTGNMPEGLTKHFPPIKLPKLQLGNISKKWRAGITHDVYNTTHFLHAWMKALQWPHLVDRSWKCPTKGKNWSGKEIQEPRIKRLHFGKKVSQAGGRRRKTKRKRKVRHRRRRRRQRTRRRQRARRH